MLGMTNIKSFIHLFNRKEWLIWTAFALGLILQLAVTELDFLNVAFATSKLGLMEWLVLLGLSSITLVVHEIIVLIIYIKNRNKTSKI